MDSRKALLPKIWKFFQSAGYGSFKVTFPSMLPFLSTIPDEILGTGPEFALLYLSNIRQGLGSEHLTREGAQELISAFLECLLFVSLKKRLYLEAKREVVDAEFGWLLNFLLCPFKLPSESQFVDSAWLSSKISGVLQKLSNKDDNSGLFVPNLFIMPHRTNTFRLSLK